MRIIGGVHKRRVIRPPGNLPVRPTTDLAKESLFNILSNRTDLQGRQVLDLFAGTGALSYEFASRGCNPVVAVDKNYQCISFIKKTAADLGMSAIRPVRADVFSYVRGCGETFDIIFADPPYQLDRIPSISREVFSKQLLNAGGWMVIEHPPEIDFSEQPHFVDHRRYGHVNFSFFRQD